MRKIYLLFLMLLIAFISTGQTSGTIQIGQGNASLAIVNNDQLPISSNWGANYTQQIILREEFLHQGAPGNITKIKWYVKDRPSSISNFNQWKVYIGYTSNNNFTSTQFISPSSNQLVWEGTLTESQMVAGSWMEFTLTTPFNYNGTSNLVVSVYENATGYTSGLTFAKYQSPFLNQGMYRRNDVQSNVSDPPTSTQTGTYVANDIAYIQFEGNLNTCNSPYNVSVSNVLPTTATLNWNIVNPPPTGGFEYEIRTDTNPGVPGANLAVSGTSLPGSLTANTSGLSPNTFYYVYVRVSCGAVWSSWSVPTFFTTLCTPQAVPYAMPLADTSGSALPECVSVQNSNGDAITWVTAAAQTGITGRVMSLSASSTLASNDWFYTKGLNLNANQVYKVSFKYKKGTAATTQKLKVMFGNTPFQTGMTNLITDLSISESSTTASSLLNYYFVPTTSGVYYLGFNGYATASQGTLYVGEISVELGPACVIPDDINITSVTKNSATINWTAPVVLPTNGYEYEIRTTGDPDSGAVGLAQSGTATSSELFKNLVGLAPSTEYKVYVRSVCSATSSSAWTDVKIFKTLCNHPDFISAPNVTRCGTGIVNLTASYSNNELVRWFSAETGGVPLHTGVNYSPTVSDPSTSFYVSAGNLVPNVDAKIVDGNLTTNGFGYNPFYSNYGGVKTQYIFKAEELINSGLAAGNLTSLSFEMNSVSSPYTGRSNFSISIGQTETASLASGFVMNVTKVYPNQEAAYTLIIDEASDIQNLIFNQPFYWDGQKNIVVQVVWNIGNSSGASNVTVKSSAAPSGLARYAAVDNLTNTQVLLDLTTGSVTGAGTSTSGTPSYRPNIYFNGTGICSSPRTEVVATVTPAPVLTLSHTEVDDFCEGDSVLITVTEGASNYDSYVWSINGEVVEDGIIGNHTTGWTFSPTVSGVYTLTALNLTSQCASVIDVTFNVNPLPLMLPLDEENQVCLGEPKELQVTGLPLVMVYSNSFETTPLQGFTFTGSSATSAISNLVSSVGTQSIKLKTVSTSGNSFLTLNNSLDLSGFNSAYLTFDNIAALEGIYGASDYGFVEYSLDGGTTWNIFILEDYVGEAEYLGATYEDIPVQIFSTLSYPDWEAVLTGSSVDPTNALWKSQRYNFPENADLSNVKIRFSLYSDGSVNYSGWYIDNVQVFGLSTNQANWSPVTNLYTDALATVPYVAGTHAGTVYFKSDVLMSATDYTATVSSSNGCIATQTTSISVIDVTEPIVTDQTICSTEVSTITVTGLQTGGTVKWYETETSTEELDEIPATGTYFVEQVVGTCKSERVSAEITLNLQLPAPVAPVDQKFCLDSDNTSYTVADLQATATTGTIGWFLNVDDITPLALTDVLATGTYYVAEFNNTCWSPKTEVEVAIGTMPAVPNGASQAFCSSKTLGEVEVGQVPGAVVNWYATADATETLSLEATLTDATYYVSQIIDFCESERVAIQVQLIPTFDAPVAPSPVLYCQEITFDDLEVTLTPGGTKGWFTTNDYTQLPEPNIQLTDVVTTGTYYVAQFNGACWSLRTPVTVTVNPTPVGLNNAAQTLCGTYTLADAQLGQVANATVKFYTTADSDVVLPMTTPLVTGTYYVSQTLNECESARVTVQFTVTEILSAPVAPVTQFYCGPTTFADLDATPTTGVIGWFASEDDTTPLDSTASVSTGVYYVAQVNGTCWSPKTMVTVTVNPVPGSLNSAAQQLCGTFTLADAALGQAPNSVVMFYPDATSEDAMELTSPLVTGTYYVSQIVLGCESPRVAVSFVVNEILVAPQAPATQLYCGPTTVASLSATPTTGTIGWFASEDETMPLVASTNVTTGTYYVAQLNGLCWSPKVAVVVTVNPIPAALNATPQQLCGTFTLADAVLGQAGNAVVKFYANPTSSTVLPLTTPLVTGTYYVTQTVAGCESPRVSVDFVVNEILPAPQAPFAQLFCGYTTVASLTATPTTGTIGWFTTQNGTTPLNMSATISSGTYYVAQLNGACWSPKTAVNVTVNTVPVPPSNENVQLCGNYNFGQVSIGQITGATLKWYDSANATTPIQSSTNVTSGTYYVSQTVGGCESVRVAVNVSQTDALSNPSAVSQTFCGTATVADLVAQPSVGATIVWYQSATAISPLAPGTLLATGTYYAAQTRNGCTSNRVPISVFVVSVTAPNVAPFNFCGSATVADLALPTPTGVIFKWFDSPSNPTPLANNVALTTGTYFVSRSQYGCESLRTPVYVTINSIPDAPTGVTPQVFMQGATINDLVMDQPNVVWYATLQNAQNGINPLVQGMPLTNGATYYGVIIGTNGCPSLPFALTVDVYLSDDKFVKNELKYYPNPVEDLLTITYSERILQIEIFDLLGKRIKVKSTDDNEVNIDLSDLASGTYMVQLKTENKSQFLKIVKK